MSLMTVWCGRAHEGWAGWITLPFTTVSTYGLRQAGVGRPRRVSSACPCELPPLLNRAVGAVAVDERNEYQVGPRFEAWVERLVADTTGATVRRGDVLVVLDPATPRIAVADASAQLAEARRRFRQTVATSGALTAAVSARSSDIDQAQAQLAAAQADFDSARVDLQKPDDTAVAGDQAQARRVEVKVE